MQASNLRRRYNKIEASVLKEENRRSADPKDSAKKSKEGKPSPKLPDSPRANRVTTHRMYTLLSAFAIAILLSLSRKPSSQALPESWALCSRAGSDSAIYTLDPEQPTVPCIVVHKGRIIDSGTLMHIRERWGDKDTTGPATKAFKMPALSKGGLKVKYLRNGEAAYPGFTDAHAHIIEYGAYQELNLAGVTSPQEAVSRVRQYVLSRPHLINDTSIWIDGQGWDQNFFPNNQYPTADDLDADDVLRGRPIVLGSKDVHVFWTSNKVIELLGDLPETIEGGLILRDENGKPTGIFVDTAMNIIFDRKPAWTQNQLQQFAQTTINDALKHGLTSIHDAAAYPHTIDFFKKMADQARLPIRLYLMGHIDSDDYWGDQITRITSDRLNVRSIKLFTDGALGSWGAALLEPYLDRPADSGIMRMSPKTVKTLVRKFVDDGWQVNVHCIGDRANQEVLDAFEEALQSKTTDAEQTIIKAANSTNPGRHRLEHAQILTQRDIQRIGQLGIIASMQPTHATSDMHIAEKRLGPERIHGAYAWKSLLKAKARLVLGSDFPVEGVNPLDGFYSAVTRLDHNGDSPHGKGGWYPEERLTREEALRGMTIDAAYAAFQENVLGSLVPGKLADIVVLRKDIMTIPAAEILKTKVRATIVEGELMYGKL